MILLFIILSFLFLGMFFIHNINGLKNGFLKIVYITLCVSYLELLIFF